MDTVPRQGPGGNLAELIDAGNRFLYIISYEEARVLRHVAEMADSFFARPRPVAVWSVTRGYEAAAAGLSAGAAAGDPVAALGAVEGCAEPEAVFVLKDFHPYLSDPRSVRKLRDVIESLRDTHRTVIVLSPELSLPDEVSKDVHVVDYPLPGPDEIELAVHTALASVSEQLGEIIALPSADREEVVRTLTGLTVDEVERIVRKVGLATHRIDAAVAGALLEEKRQVIRKSEVLDYIQNDLRLEHLGGMAKFKRWANVRAAGLTEAARAFGLPKPKGMLFTGISGCGKSLAVQALANEWSLPLLRLDMGRVFAGVAGSPEEAMRRVFKTVEAVAPAMLWIDEIEMGVSIYVGSRQSSGETNRVFAMFLTWMQEKEAMVIVGATANDIDRLPPEFIRKGRFDEVFFVDLPNAEERRQIFKVHLNRRGKDISDVSVEGLARGTEGFSGAEIEQGIITAMYEAFAEGRELTIDDIYRAMGRMVPLAVTMKEQITKTKRWAENRAVRAS